MSSARASAPPVQSTQCTPTLRVCFRKCALRAREKILADLERNFIADHVSPALPEVMAAMVAANTGTKGSYGMTSMAEVTYDADAEEARRRLSDLFETQVDALFVPTGTASNSIALACLAPRHGGIYCASGSHANNDECGCPELFSGAKLLPIRTCADGRMDLDELFAALGKPLKFPHEALPTAVSLTQPTEAGFCYSLEQVASVCRAVKVAEPPLRVHMDGARFPQALDYFARQAAAAGRAPPTLADLT